MLTKPPSQEYSQSCWICGAPSGSGEHLIKASDVRNRFGLISPDDPIYLHLKERRNRPVRGMKSKALKSEAPMCGKCNNERTQPYDVAWARLAEALSSRSSIRANDRIRLQRIFPGHVKRSMLHVHLYFVKAFGCKVREARPKIELQPFAESLLTCKPNANVFVAVCPPFEFEIPTLINSDITANEINGQVANTVWYYSLDYVCVRVAYFRTPIRSGRYWHPDSIGKVLRISENFS